MDATLYAVWCYGTGPEQRSLILEEAAKIQNRLTLRNPNSDPWNDPRFWIVTDWALAWGASEDLKAIESAIPEGPARNEFSRIRGRIQEVQGFFEPSTRSKSTAEAQEKVPTGELNLMEKAELVSFSQIRVKLQPAAPLYPREAKDRKMMTVLKVEMTIDPEGRPVRCRPLPGPWLAFFGPTALKYSLDWRFEPARLNGIPQYARFLLTMPFRLSR